MQKKILFVLLFLAAIFPLSSQENISSQEKKSPQENISAEENSPKEAVLLQENFPQQNFSSQSELSSQKNDSTQSENSTKKNDSEEVINEENAVQNDKKETEHQDIEKENQNLEEPVTEELLSDSFADNLIPSDSIILNGIPSYVYDEYFNKDFMQELEKSKIQHYLIPGITEEELSRPEVEKFRKMYLNEKWAALLKTCLETAMEYRLYVRKSVADEGLPAYLEYLPVVESNYKTNAKSKSGAIGMWQFMENSVYPFLTLNDFVDERLDPWKSTEAALKKLQDNYKTFGDWYIAIAAYNCGAGAMTRILKKAEEKNFWYLLDHKLLPAQTADYVPKLIAIADLSVNAEYYGISLPTHEEEFEVLENEKNGVFDYITVTKAYSISQLATEMRMDLSELKRLNPSYTRGMTHPTKKSEIRLPVGMKQSAEDALAKLEPIEFPFTYKVVSGDSLWSISRKFKVTVQSICDLNNIRENDILKIGKILYIPAK